MILLQFMVVLLAIYYGAKLGGIGVGAMGGAGLLVLTFIFKIVPTSPPIDVMLIIIAVIVASSTLQASGGMDYLVQLAERLIQKHPPMVTFIAPLVAFSFTVLTGTGMTAFAVMPVIVEVAKKANIRPEAPLSMAAVASQVAITAAPISAAVVGLLALLNINNPEISLLHVLLVTVPSLLIAIAITAVVVNRFSGKLSDDPIYQQRLAEGRIKNCTTHNPEEQTITKNAKNAVYIFVLTIIAIVLIASFRYLPSQEINGVVETTKVTEVIQIFMLTCAGLILIFTKSKVTDAINGSVFKSGMSAVVAVMGIAWLGDTFFSTHLEFLKATLGGIATEYPWAFAFILFIMSWFLFSQAATTAAVIPLGITLGIPAPFLIAMFPAVSGLFIIPNYPTVVAAIEFDDTGTTKIGKYLFNHSFMLPGCMIIALGVIFGFVMQAIVF